MRRLVLALPLVVVLGACGTDDDDTGGAGGTVPIVSDSGDTELDADTVAADAAAVDHATGSSPSQPSRCRRQSPPVSSALPGTPIDPTMPLVTARSTISPAASGSSPTRSRWSTLAP